MARVAGFNGWPASVQIGYATSDDGLKWTEVSPDPVMMTDFISSLLYISFKTLSKSVITCLLMAFNLSGRLIVTVSILFSNDVNNV